MHKEILYLVSFIDHLMYDYFAYKIWARDEDEATRKAMEKYANGEAAWEWTLPCEDRDGRVPVRQVDA